MLIGDPVAKRIIGRDRDMRSIILSPAGALHGTSVATRYQHAGHTMQSVDAAVAIVLEFCAFHLPPRLQTQPVLARTCAVLFWILEMQLLQQPEKIIFLYGESHEFRQVRLNTPHPAHITPSWYSDSDEHARG